MNPQQLLQFILQSSFTPVEALKKLRILKDRVSSKLYSQPTTNLPITDQSTPIRSESTTEARQNEWLDSLGDQFYLQFNQQNFTSLFQATEEEIKKTKTLIITLPFEITYDKIAELTNHLRQSFGAALFIDIKFDPGLIAGPAFIWNGISKDYSIKQKIADNHTEILKIMKEYVNKSNS